MFLYLTGYTIINTDNIESAEVLCDNTASLIGKAGVRLRFISGQQRIVETNGIEEAKEMFKKIVATWAARRIKA